MYNHDTFIHFNIRDVEVCSFTYVISNWMLCRQYFIIEYTWEICQTHISV